MTLSPARPSTTNIDPKRYFGFYVTRDDPEGLLYQYFGAEYAAFHFLDILINDTPYKWKNDTTIRVEGDIPLEIRGYYKDTLERVLEYKMTKEERAYDMPAAELRALERFRDGRRPSGLNEDFNATAHPPAAPTSTKEPGISAPKAPRTPKTPSTPKPSKDGLVTIAKIAEDNKWDAKHARAALRKANISKPDAGWAFPPSDVARITKAIKENLK